MVIVVCREHVDIGLDRYVDEQEEAPELSLLKEAARWMENEGDGQSISSDKICDEKGCQNHAEFVLHPPDNGEA